MLTFLFQYADWGILLLRVIFGLIFLAHGLAKIKNLRATQEWFGSIGFRPGKFWGTLVALTETAGGFLVILGLLTQVAAAFLAIVMLVALGWKIKNGQKLISGYEFDLILLAVALAFFTNSGGLYSLDAYWRIVLL
jgi:putative oxidoreductase